MPDNWESQTLGDVFPAMKEASEKLKEQGDDLFGKANFVLDKFSQQVTEINDAITKANNSISRLAEAGIYTLKLEPAAGEWSLRAINAEGAPPDLGFCAGVLIIVTAPNLEEVAAKFQKIEEVLTSPIL